MKVKSSISIHFLLRRCVGATSSIFGLVGIFNSTIILLFAASAFAQVNTPAGSGTQPLNQTTRDHSSLTGNVVPSEYLRGSDRDLYGTTTRFIENIGQYGEVYERYPGMGKILYAYEGFDVPVLFTSRGLIYIHRKVKGPKLTEIEIKERKRKKFKKESEIEEMQVIDRAITMEWSDANAGVEVIAEEQTKEYHTYGLAAGKARAFKRITYRNLYAGIDLTYTFTNNTNVGFEYSLVVRPGADVSVVKRRYGGDFRRIKKDAAGNLVLTSKAGTTAESVPVTYYGESVREGSGDFAQPIESSYELRNNEVRFSFPEKYDNSKGIVIDPFVTATGNLTGTGANAGLAKDVDFDYAGNVYITGGGNGSVYKLAKVDAAGVLQWTFSGSLTIPAWNFGTYYGGWVADKNTGGIYLGQGFAPSGGHRVIRINTTGIYDNYITTANASFLENWKMYWNCNNGSAQILIAGGGTNSNINFGIISPPSTVISSLNVTGIPYSAGTGWAQDISDVIIDPANNDLYTIYGSLYGTPYLSNQIYKNTAPYSGATVAWNTASGYVVIQEITNRPYLVGPEIDNSSNVFAINSSYLFYWDGKNLKAFDKSTGAGVGTPLSIGANIKLMCGGIVADECNNVFAGSMNGTIKVYYFDGTTFDDAARPDITIPGYAGSPVYDLAYYEAQKLVYASGRGFVGSFDVSAYNCMANSFTLNVNSNCGTLAATTTISPLPPTGSTVTYVLYNGNTQITSNTTGAFSGLTPNVNYTVKATVNMVCSGVVTTTNFTLPGPAIAPAVTNSACAASTGAITITASNGTGPYTYSKDGSTFQGSNVFSGLAAGLYTITVKDVNGCSNTAVVNVLNANGPVATFTKTDATCGSNTGTITATGTGGAPPLTYSINGINFQTGNFFTGLVAGTYTLTVKDSTGCSDATLVTIINASAPAVLVIPASTYCSTLNGSITASGSGGVPPLQYSINGNTYQGSGFFTGLAAGTYTVTVKDANGCLNTASATVANQAGPTVTAVAVAAKCANSNGTITATGTGGTLPLQYSINGSTFQAGNYFSGLAPGIYIVTVRDANNCTNTVAVTVSSTNSPQVTATFTASACSGNTGTITASGSGGTGLLQYSINGTTFQSSTLFSGLAAGSYVVYVRDASGCLGAVLATVPNSTSPTVTAIATPASCSASDGIITAAGAGGTAPYQYNINGGAFQAGTVFNALAIGTYTVTVSDANGCLNATTVTVNNVAGLSFTASVISSACSVNSGSITALATGGVAPLQYSINGVTYQGSNTFSTLAGGNYTIYVKDAGGCVVSKAVTVISALAPQLAVTWSDATCTGSNATITATGSGGTPPLRYSINGVTYQSSGLFINLAAGTYTVYVKDTSNCMATASVTIANNGAGPGITTFTASTSAAWLCNGSLGKISNFKVNGGSCSACSFSLDFGAYIPNASEFANLSPGTYTVTAMDANGCTKTISAVVKEGVVFTATPVVTGTPCNTANGTIKLTGSGANQPYHASISGIGGPWADFDPSYTFTGLSAGTYTIILADDESYVPGDPGGCLDTITVVVPSIGGPTITTTKDNGTCATGNGSITVSGSGTDPLLYGIDGFYQSDSIFYFLSSGIYTISVLDADGCESFKIDTIVNPSGPEVTAADVTPASCGNANGKITVTAAGGTAPYQYSINGTVYQSSNVFTGLASGTYTLWVGDASSCLSTATVTVTALSRPTVTAFAIAASCNSSNGLLSATGANGATPYQYSIDGTTFQSSNVFAGLAAGAYTVTIRDANGCLNTAGVAVGNLSAPQLALASTSSTCFAANGTITATGNGGSAPLQYSIDGITYQAGTLFTALTAGTYTVYVKDANGCINSKSILITNPIVPQTLSATVTNASCGNSNGSIIASATGGVSTLQYSINGITWQTSTTFSALAGATYTLTVKDANGCTKAMNVVVTNLAGPSVTAVPTLSSCFANDGTITATGTGGTGALTYSKNGVTFQSSTVFTALAPGIYTITVKDTKNCTSATSVTLGKVAGPVISATLVASGCGDTIVLNQSGGVPAYQYNLDNSNYQGSNKFPCKLSGTYTARVIDANGCIDSIIVTLSNSLPIELLSFTGHAEAGYNALEWTTASEINNDYFTIERSVDGQHFEPLAVVDGAGNSSVHLHYAEKDMHPFGGINYYRLKQNDYDGSFHYSRIIAILSKSNATAGYSYSSILNELIIYCNGCSGEQQKIKLTDAAGREIYSTTADGPVYRINTESFARGFYTLLVKSGNDIYNYKVVIY